MASFQELKSTADERWQEVSSGETPWIRIGTAMCGHAAGAVETLEAVKAELASLEIEARVDEVGCIGLCYAEPLLDILKAGKPRTFFRNVTADEVPALLRSYLVRNRAPKGKVFGFLGEGSADGVTDLSSIPSMKLQHRIALRNAGHIVPADLDQYIANGGYSALHKALFDMKREDVLGELKESGLRGRGGAAFPTGMKLGFLVNSPGPTKYILCNCEEGDPGAYNDKGILESDPFTLIEGLTLAGYGTSASNGMVFIRHGHDGPIDRTEQAIKAAYDAGLLGENILGTDFSYEVEVSLTGESYVAGEETALMESVEGKRSMPRSRPPFPAAVGLWGKPSNINNVKTLAYIPEIILKGGAWFSSIGVNKSTGTAILCLSGNITYPGLYEVPMGMSLGQVIDEVGGGVPGGKELKLLQTGGPLGGVLGADSMGITLDFEEMAKAGAILGSGGIIVADQDTCAVDLTRVLVAFCQFESCGKCFPCRLGTSNLLDIVERIVRLEGRPGDLEQMRTIGETMQAGSLCGHGQLGFNPIRSAIEHFEADFKAHIEEKRCPTGSCSKPILSPINTRPFNAEPVPV